MPDRVRVFCGNRVHRFLQSPVVAGWLVAGLLATPVPLLAQTVEITPFGGYRIGGSIGEVGGRAVVDDDGGPSIGVVVDVVFGSNTEGLRVEGVFSRERTRLKLRGGAFDPVTYADVEVDQILVGGIQELSDGRARPFLSGLVGLTRYAAPGDTEVRFAVGMGTGVKLFATRNIGLRLDARGYMTIVSTSGAAVCSGGCVIAFSVSPAFQGDLTAGLVLAF
jgi:hypothetical protein